MPASKTFSSMILGIGSDLVEIVRVAALINRFGERFLTRIFTPHEQKSGTSPSYYAKRFAAKEAFLKALGTGLRSPLTWQDIEVRSTDLGQPFFRLSGAAAQRIPQNAHCFLTLSDEKNYALAFVVISQN